MIKIENDEIFGWEAAIRGARNPMNSWGRMDSDFYISDYENNRYKFECVLGPNDYNLLRKLSSAGPDHGKFMRMITVYVDITAPLYWWKEFDTYKVGTVANSCSTMHKVHDKEFELSDFSYEHLDPVGKNSLLDTCSDLNIFRKKYLETKEKFYWWHIIQLLPSSYNQRRTIMLNYAVLKNIYKARKNHKLDEWNDFCKWIEKLPYSILITDDK